MRNVRNLCTAVLLLGTASLGGSAVATPGSGITITPIANGRFGMAGAFVALHGGVFLAALALLWWRDHAAVLHFRRARRKAPP